MSKYTFTAEIIIFPESPLNEKVQLNCKNIYGYIRMLLSPYDIETTLSESYYHPDEEHECAGIDFVKYHIRIEHEIVHASSLVDLTLILQHTVSLLNRCSWANLRFEIHFD